MRLHAPIHLIVGEVCTIMKECLTYLIIGSIVQVFGSERRCVNHGKTQIGSLNDVLFSQLHARCSLLCFCSVSVFFCAGNEAVIFPCSMPCRLCITLSDLYLNCVLPVQHRLPAQAAAAVSYE